MNNIYDRIKMLVKENDITIDYLMKEVLNSTGNSFQGWQRRKVYPRADECLKLAQYFSTSVEWLLTGKNTISSYSPRIKKIADKLSTLSEENLNTVENIIRIMPNKKEEEINSKQEA